MKIFMTGATGFVGTYLAGRLINEGNKVTILTPSLTGTERKTDDKEACETHSLNGRCRNEGY